MIRSPVLVPLFLALLAPVSAQTMPPDAFREACKADFVKYCAAVKPGEGRLEACFRDNEPNLSSGCREAVDWVKTSR